MQKITWLLFTLLIIARGVLIAQIPVANFSPLKDSTCGSSFIGNFTDLSTNSPTSWKWNFPGATPDTSTLENPMNIMYSGIGCYTVKLVVKNNSGSDSLIDSNAICLDAPPHIVFTGPTGLCQYESGTITVYGGTQYHWSTGQTTSSINITGIISETFTVEVNSGACYKDTSISVAVNAPPSWRFAGDTSICLGDSTTISATPLNGGYTYLWSTGSTTDSILVHGATPGFYTYTLIVTNSGCADSAKITVGVNVCTGIDNIVNGTEQIVIYPNTSNGQFTFDFNTPVTGTLEIYDITGQRVYQKTIQAEKIEINLSGQPAGMYFYRVLTNTGSLFGEGKVIIQK